MSISNYFWGPAGVRNTPGLRFAKYSCEEPFPEEYITPHQVFLAHGANFYIDEQYFFETAEDALWFWEEGYKRFLFEPYGLYDHMTLWIDDKEVQSRSAEHQPRGE